MEENLQRIAETLSRPDWVGIIASIGAMIAAIAAAVSAFIAKRSSKASFESNVLQKEQIELQNKQNLFEIKSKNLTILNKFVTIYEKNKNEILSYNDTDELIGNSLSDSTMPLLLSLIGREFDINRISQKTSLLNAPAFSGYIKEAIEEIEYALTEISLLFSDKIGSTSAIFLDEYKSLIVTLYNYALNSEAERRGAQDKSLEIVGNFYSLGSITKKLATSYKTIEEEKILKKMEDEIKLKNGSKK